MDDKKQDGIFEASLASSMAFSQIFTALHNLGETVEMRCHAKRNITLFCLSREIMCDVNIDEFTKYSCPYEVSFGLPSASMRNILKRLDKNDTVHLRAKLTSDPPDIDGPLDITFESELTTRSFSLHTLSVLFIPRRPTYAFEASTDSALAIPSHKFGLVCKNLSQFCDTLKIEQTAQTTRVIAEGVEVTAAVTLKCLNENKSQSNKIGAYYSTENLLIALSNGAHLCTNVLVEFLANKKTPILSE